MGYWRDEAVNDMENMIVEQTFGVCHNVRMRHSPQKRVASWKKRSTFFIAYTTAMSSTVELYVGSKVQTSAKSLDYLMQDIISNMGVFSAICALQLLDHSCVEIGRIYQIKFVVSMLYVLGSFPNHQLSAACRNRIQAIQITNLSQNQFWVINFIFLSLPPRFSLKEQVITNT